MLKILDFLSRKKWRFINGGLFSIFLMFGVVFMLLGLKPAENTKIVPTLKEVTEIDEKKDSKFSRLSEKKETGEEETNYFVFKNKNKFEEESEETEAVSPAFNFKSVRKRNSHQPVKGNDTVSAKQTISEREIPDVGYGRPKATALRGSSASSTRSVRGGNRVLGGGGGSFIDLSQPVVSTQVEEKPKERDIFNFGSKSESSGYESSSFESEWIKIELNQDTKIKSGVVSILTFRLNDNIVINGETYSKGSTLIGQATFKKSRILVSIHSIKDLKNHNTASIVMGVYDVDKAEGILFDRKANKQGGKIIKDAVNSIAREVPFGGIIRGATKGLSGGGKVSATLRKGSVYFLKN